MDQTMVRVVAPGKKTISPKGVKEVSVSHPTGDREGFTVNLTIRADGFKYPAEVIFKTTAKAGVRVVNGWIKRLSNPGFGQLTSLAGVLSDAYIAELNVPENIVVRSARKVWWNGRFDDDYVDNVPTTLSSNPGYIKKPGKNESIQMVSSAWKKVDVEVVKKSFYAAELLWKSDVLPEFNEITWLWFPTTCEKNRCELTTDAKCLADRSSRYEQTASVSGNKSCKRSKFPPVCVGEMEEEESYELDLSFVKDSSFFEEETNDSDPDMEAEEEEDEDN
ncbi:hypothetical protein RvY_18530 [Ramazzottius varieornatus]|uniref:Uncharacterized protein n=1 Tax=Ramazzottius varieornatus TaxID=947166 RepID=A0A1D1W6G8_RAMVA|nr:hypothetical protein RvY_18530 [Ramazzottius varieornatus]